MNYHNITKCDLLNGEGLRVVLWVSGCNHHCKGCQNPQTWDEESGIVFDKQAEKELFEALEPNYISGITFSGGDPLYPKNRYEITKIAKKIKEKYPQKNVWLYTGYKFFEVQHLPIMKYIDVVVDGEYIEELNDINYQWAGSTNQKIIRLKNENN